MASTADFFNDVLEDKATILFPGEGETLSVNGGSMVLKITSPMSKDQLGVYEITLLPKTIGAQLAEVPPVEGAPGRVGEDVAARRIP